MVSEQAQHQQFQDRISRLNRKVDDFEALRVKPAPINSNFRLIGILAGVLLILGVFGYAASIVLEAQALAREAEQKSEPIQPKIIKLDGKAKD